MSAWWIGVDPASQQAGLAAFNEDGRLRVEHVTVKGAMPNRLVELRLRVREFIAALTDDGVWAIVVERPVTHHGGATLFGAYGVCVEAAAATCPSATLLTLHPHEIDTGTRKGKRKDRTAALAAKLGYDGPSQDVCDAVVAADAARRLTTAQVA